MRCNEGALDSTYGQRFFRNLGSLAQAFSDRLNMLFGQAQTRLNLVWPSQITELRNTSPFREGFAFLDSFQTAARQQEALVSQMDRLCAAGDVPDETATMWAADFNALWSTWFPQYQQALLALPAPDAPLPPIVFNYGVGPAQFLDSQPSGAVTTSVRGEAAPAEAVTDLSSPEARAAAGVTLTYQNGNPVLVNSEKSGQMASIAAPIAPQPLTATAPQPLYGPNAAPQQMTGGGPAPVLYAQAGGSPASSAIAGDFGKTATSSNSLVALVVAVLAVVGLTYLARS